MPRPILDWFARPSLNREANDDGEELVLSGEDSVADLGGGVGLALGTRVGVSSGAAF